MQGRQGLQSVPACAFLPAEAMAPEQVHSNCSMGSLASGSAAAQEGGSRTAGMPTHGMGALAQQASLQLGPEGASLAARQGRQPHLQASELQGLPNVAAIHHRSSFQGE